MAKRANCTIEEMIRNMLHVHKLDKPFWVETVVNVVYTRNRCPTKALDSITSEETWSGRRPCIAHMRVFGCVAYAIMPDVQRDKLDSKGTKCLLLGYYEGTKAYRLMCL